VPRIQSLPLTKLRGAVVVEDHAEAAGGRAEVAGGVTSRRRTTTKPEGTAQPAPWLRRTLLRPTMRTTSVAEVGRAAAAAEAAAAVGAAGKLSTPPQMERSCRTTKAPRPTATTELVTESRTEDAVAVGNPPQMAATKQPAAMKQRARAEEGVVVDSAVVAAGEAEEAATGRARMRVAPATKLAATLRKEVGRRRTERAGTEAGFAQEEAVVEAADAVKGAVKKTRRRSKSVPQNQLPES
jgi:hypothetical protein